MLKTWQEKNSLTHTVTQSDRTQRTQKSGKKIVLRFWQSTEKMEQIMFNINANTGQTHICLKKGTHFYTQSQWDYMNISRIRDRYTHLLYWDIQASLFLSKLTEDILRDECILSYKKLISYSFWWLSSFFWRSTLPKTSNSPKI